MSHGPSQMMRLLHLPVISVIDLTDKRTGKSPDLERDPQRELALRPTTNRQTISLE